MCGFLQVRDFPKIVFYAPALCDMIATSTMYLGLTLTYASSFQMLRGEYYLTEFVPLGQIESCSLAYAMKTLQHFTINGFIVCGKWLEVICF